ncbi:MAG: hypothetical protein GVY25_09025, partial [Bacteroidetes bacterium]|nr:hypothetical protein [Bacteroidota bacterium]
MTIRSSTSSPRRKTRLEHGAQSDRREAVAAGLKRVTAASKPTGRWCVSGAAVLLGALFLMLAGCAADASRSGPTRPAIQQADPTADSADTLPPGFVQEAVPRRIPINGPAGRRAAQLSGLAWWGDRLLLLPQYPDAQGDTV